MLLEMVQRIGSGAKDWEEGISKKLEENPHLKVQAGMISEPHALHLIRPSGCVQIASG